jgi:hypothetical protein
VKDYRASIEKLRKDAANAALIRDQNLSRTFGPPFRTRSMLRCGDDIAAHCGTLAVVTSV